jgi:hypothetical protein
VHMGHLVTDEKRDVSGALVRRRFAMRFSRGIALAKWLRGGYVVEMATVPYQRIGDCPDLLHGCTDGTERLQLPDNRSASDVQAGCDHILHNYLPVYCCVEAHWNAAGAPSTLVGADEGG